MPSAARALQFNREAALSSIEETMENGSYLADLFANHKIEPAIYHYIITQRGSTEILDWGQGFTMDSMREQAGAWMQKSMRRIA